MEKVRISDGSGVLERYAAFPSQFTNARNVDVWLPTSYHEQPEQRFPVLYMHDGQNLFDPALSFSRVDWGVDEAINKLARAGEIEAPIVVGIWNSPTRRRDYMPEKALLAPEAKPVLNQFIKQQGGAPLSEGYLRFLVEELKPLIDSTYRSLPDQPHTHLMGSSMGALISMYAIFEYPDVFNGAGCLSTHWPAGREALIEYVWKALPDAGKNRFYFDYGTEAMDAEYEPFQLEVDDIFQAKGYKSGIDWQTRKFEGAEHSERAWRKRVHIPLQFLIGKANKTQTDPA